MQAYDLVKLRSTAPCRIVGIAAASEGGAVAGVIGKRQSRMIGELDLFLSGDFLTPSPTSRKDHPSATTVPAGQHRRQVRPAPATGNENPAHGIGSGADYYHDRHVIVAGGTGAIGTAMVGALLEAGAARARRCLKFCEIAGIKADGSAQDWASLYQQRIGQQTSTSHGAAPARSSATGLADGRAKPSPP